jgi:N-acetylglucosaminyl-diphospho-decaprenol L-rhamnosyltransferase
MPMSHEVDQVVPDDPRIAIVIVTYNSADVLTGCLDSLTGASQGVRLTDVIVVDNASKDDSLAIAMNAADLPIQTIELGRNAGYAAAINAGTEALDTEEFDAVFVMNPDCRLRPGALAVLAGSLSEEGRGITVPRLINPDGTLQPSLRRRPSVRRAMVEAVIGGRLAGRIGTFGELITDPREYERPHAAVWATGAAMLISVVAMQQIGLWDESFLLYSEETDFALRGADLGWTLWFEPAALVEHIGGEASTNPTLAALLCVNKVRLFRRRRGSAASLVYYLAVVFGEGARALAGRRTSRAAVVALVRPSRRIHTLAN